MYGLGLGLELNVFSSVFNSFCKIFWHVHCWPVFGCAGSSLVFSGFSLVVDSGGCCLLAVHSLLTVVASLVWTGGLGAWASIIVGHGLSSCDFLAPEAHRLQ